MIQITDKSACCGCSACVQRCPKQCISLHEDEEGFLYPQVDASSCIDCGLCEKVCPVLHRGEARNPQRAFAAKNPDLEVRRASSSGGIFSLLARQTISRGGVVFGARFNDDWEVVHASAETEEEAAAFRGSKYVQSRIGAAYREAEALLKSGREVLFSGTPCQIAGLRLFLRKDYPNLTAVDFICHGVPSPGVFRRYLEEEKHKFARKREKNTVSPLPYSRLPKATASHEAAGGVRVEAVAFRDKRKGWKKYSFFLSLSEASAEGEKNTVSSSYTLQEHPYLRGFLSDIYLRPSCYSCPAKGCRSGSDITIGDFWGIGRIHPELDDDLGVSAVLAVTEKGAHALERCGMSSWESSAEEIIAGNPALIRPAKPHPRRKEFFERLSSGEAFIPLVVRLCRPTPRQRITRLFRRAAHKFATLLGWKRKSRKHVLK